MLMVYEFSLNVPDVQLNQLIQYGALQELTHLHTVWNVFLVLGVHIVHPRDYLHTFHVGMERLLMQQMPPVVLSALQDSNAPMQRQLQWSATMGRTVKVEQQTAPCALLDTGMHFIQPFNCDQEQSSPLKL